MKLSEIAIKVTNRNRKAVIGWLENTFREGDKPSDHKKAYIHREECYLSFKSNTWYCELDYDDSKKTISFTQAKAIYGKENRPQPTHEQLKSERGRSAMYKMKYEQLRKDYDFDALTFGKSLERKSELNEEVSTLKRKLDVVNREYERTNEQLVSEKQQMVIANGKTIKELDLHKEQVVELENNNDALVNEKHKLHSELLDSEKDHKEDAKSYRVNLEKMQKYINELEADKRNLTAEVSVLRTSKSELHILTDELKYMNERAINEKYSLKGKLSKTKKQRNTALITGITFLIALLASNIF